MGPLVITGMHRSGTSLIASAFQLAGVNVGEKLDGPSRGNQRGHFEDIEFQKFHDRVLERVGKNFLTATRADLEAMTPDDVERAKAMLDRRRARPLWGWKDPRTSLFLEFWHPLLDAPRYVFVYRHPLEVVLSLFRRAWYVEEVENPLTALEAWRQHNQAILDFYQSHREWCLLGHIRPMAADLVGTVGLCKRRLGLDLVSESASAVYQPSELTPGGFSGDVLAEFARIAPSAAVLYQRLEQAADLSEGHSRCPADPMTLAGAHGDGRREADTLRRDFEVLLARLEPRTFATGKAALDTFRQRELESIDAHRRHLATELAAHQARLADLEIRNTELHARAAELTIQNGSLQSEVTVAERLRTMAESRLEAQNAAHLARDAQRDARDAQRDARDAQRDADMTELRRSLDETRRGLGELTEQAAARLTSIEQTLTQSATWRTLKRAVTRMLPFWRTSS